MATTELTPEIEGLPVDPKSYGKYVYDESSAVAEIIGVSGQFVQLQYLDDTVLIDKHPSDLTWY